MSEGSKKLSSYIYPAAAAAAARIQFAVATMAKFSTYLASGERRALVVSLAADALRSRGAQKPIYFHPPNSNATTGLSSHFSHWRLRCPSARRKQEIERKKTTTSNAIRLISSRSHCGLSATKFQVTYMKSRRQRALNLRVKRKLGATKQEAKATTTSFYIQWLILSELMVVVPNE